MLKMDLLARKRQGGRWFDLLLINWLQVRVLSGSQVSIRPQLDDVEQFLASLRFENRGKLDDLGLEIGSNTLKFSY
jgi:hypothetical protein